MVRVDDRRGPASVAADVEAAVDAPLGRSVAALAEEALLLGIVRVKREVGADNGVRTEMDARVEML